MKKRICNKIILPDQVKIMTKNINFKVIFMVGRIMPHSYSQRYPSSNPCESVTLCGKGKLKLLIELRLLALAGL